MLPVFIILLSTVIEPIFSQTANFKVTEESLIDTVIGNIAHLHSSLNHVSYYISSPFLKLSERGDLLISSRIDLESICSQYEMCCGEIECFIKTNVIAKDKNSDRSESITILLTIADKNDNSPRFTNPKQIIQVAENEPVGTYLFVDQAQDADVNPSNKVTQYTLQESTGTFQLDESRLPSIGLIVKKNIDYESKHFYEATLEACDAAKQCGKQKIQIEILDKNDNFPVFVKENYEMEILENFSIGQQILMVRAIDKDSSKYNQVMYGFHDPWDRNLQNTFIITENTGSIKLQKKLSANIRQKYKFKVFAVDKMAMSSHKALANVIINVKDLNDNSPIITQLPSDLRLEIFENELPKQMLTLQVTDKDIGENANVSCNLLLQSANDFQMKHIKNELYELYTLRSFNYEIEKQVKAVIECFDHGVPRNTVQKPMILHIKDVNEYSPQFDQEFYKLKLLENRPPLFYVAKVNASDQDTSAILRYEFIGDAEMYFTIDLESGIINTGKRTLDREKMSKIEIIVRVTDSIENPKTGQCTIIVEILDENDNSPRFIVNTSNMFFMTENKPIDTRANGAVTAIDDDVDEGNSKVLYQVRRLFNARKELITENLFRIIENGNIFNLQRLDREVNSNYTVEIRALDTGLPTRSTNMNFTIIIDDVNDNSPLWINPKTSNGAISTLNISANTQPGDVILKLKAHDLDENENGKVTYSIINNNKILFYINSSSGDLSVARMLPLGSIQLHLRAVDNGYPPLQSETSLLVFINGDEAATLNMSIIMVLIGVTGIVSIFLIIAIICVRRRPRYDHTDIVGSDQVFETPKTENLYYTGTWMQNNNDIPCHQNITDTNGVLYYPNDVESSLPMHTFVSKTNISHPLINYQNMDNSCYATMTNNSGPFLRSCGTSSNSQSNLLRTPNSICCDISNGSIGRFNDIDDDSADSGKGGSEDDTGLHQIPLLGTYNSFDNNGKNRLYTTMPYQGRGLNGGRLGLRNRGNMPPTINQCPCYILPEDSIIQSGQTSLSHSNCYHTTLQPNSNRELNSIFDSYNNTMQTTLSHNISSSIPQFELSQGHDRLCTIPNLESTEIQ